MTDPIVIEDIYPAAFLAMRGVPVEVVEDPARSRQGRPYTVFHVPRPAAPLLGEYMASPLAEFAQAVKALRDRARGVRRKSA